MLDEVDNKRYQHINGAVIYHGLVSHYDILLALDQLAGAISKHSISYKGLAKNLLRSLARSVNVSITYK